MDTTLYAHAIYAILDTVANQIIGGLYLQKHEAAAVRFFADVASGKDSIVGQHPQDFDLVQLGYVAHDNTIEAQHKVVLKGSTWAAMTAPSKTPDLEVL